MTDVLTKDQRSYCMSNIRSTDTKPEKKLKYILINKGFLYQPKIYGRPDFINFQKRIVIFIDGCFWHKCPKHFKQPSTNKKFWKNKLDKNVIRDLEVTKNYKYSGWRVIRIWEHKKKLLGSL